MKIRELEGSQEEIIAYLEWLEAHEKPTKSSPIEDLMAADANMPVPEPKVKFAPLVKPQTIPPARAPPKERTAKLEAYFRDYLQAGLNAKAIQEHLIKEHDISMSGHQVAGWMGRMKQKGCHSPKAGGKSSEETSLQTSSEDATREPTDGITINAFRETLQEVMTQGSKCEDKASPPWPGDLSEPDLTIWRMHREGCLTIEIMQTLDRMGHCMKVGDIRKRIDQMKAEAI